MDGIEAGERFAGPRDTGDKCHDVAAVLMRVSDDLNQPIGRVAEISRIGTRMRDFAYLVAGIEQFGGFDEVLSV